MSARDASYRDPTLLVPRRWWEHWEWVLIVMAVLGDLAAFYVVLGLLFESRPSVVAMVAIGFTAGAIGIATAVGRGMARRRCSDSRASLPLLVSCAAAWLFLGSAAFLARYRFSPEAASSTGGSARFPTGGTAAPAPAAVPDTDQALIAALVFAALYLVSGLCAIYAAYNTHNPDASAYRRTLTNLDNAVGAETKSRARLERAEQLLRQHEQEHQREAERWQAAREQAIALMFDLQNYARHVMATGKQNPSATDGLTETGPVARIGMGEKTAIAAADPPVTPDAGELRDQA
ncbi:MAG: hypothetical protein GEU83_06335 [Pseudonocardiaceae bacterium]|nr:hypothetical protein [Pseudonocardiaceae bacterium]